MINKCFFHDMSGVFTASTADAFCFGRESSKAYEPTVVGMPRAGSVAKASWN